MKRLAAACVMAGVLFALGTVGAAKEVTASLPVDATWDNTVSKDFSKSGGNTNISITWFQPYELATPAAPDVSAYPAGTMGGPDLQVASAKLTITAWGVNPAAIYNQPAEKDAVYVGPSKDGPWTALGTNLAATKALHGRGDSVTAITLSDPNLLLKADGGFWVRVKLEDGNQDDYIKSAQLQVTVTATYTYTYTPKKVIFVSAQHASTADANVPGDKGFVDLLEAAHYEVEYVKGWETLDPNKVADLDAADLVIVSRDSSAADLATDADEIVAWNNVKAPVMLLNSYLAAADGWQWFDAVDQDARQPYLQIKALDRSSPVFASVKFTAQYKPPEVNVPETPADANAVPADVNAVPADANTAPIHVAADEVVDANAVTVDPNAAVVVVVVDMNDMVPWYEPNVASGYASFIKTAAAGNGKILAVVPETGTVLIAEWAAGTPFSATSALTPAGPRLFFNAGTQEVPDELTGWGVMNLNAVGQKIFLNAVAYLIPAPAPVAEDNTAEPSATEGTTTEETTEETTTEQTPVTEG